MSTSSGSSSQAPAPPLSPAHPPAGEGAKAEKGDRAKKASIACLACKQRKTRCSASTPCTACHARGTPCVYDASADQRRKVANQRNLEQLARREEELQRHRLLLGGILAMVRSEDGDVTAHLLAVIRSNTPLPDLTSYVSNAMTLRRDLNKSFQQLNFDLGAPLGDVPASPTAPLARAGQRDDRYNQGFLNNTPITVDAQPWTSLATSEVVSHLFSLYFTWQQPLFQFVDKTAFLAGYKSGDFSSNFCSRLLVHAILAHACLISQRVQGKNLQNQLFSEAKIYLEIEAGRARMPTLQALLIMLQYEGDRGRDRLGRNYRHQAVDIYRRLGAARQQKRPGHFDDDEWCAVTTTIWGTFSFDAMTSFLYGFVPMIKPPAVERYFADSRRADLDNRADTWSPYPMIRPARPAHMRQSLHALCDLAIIFGEITSLNETSSNNPAVRDSVSARTTLSDALLAWSRSMDPAIRLHGTGDEDTSPPHIFYLHIFHHLAYILLLRPLQDEPDLVLPENLNKASIFSHATAAIDTLFALKAHLSFTHSSGIALICPIVVGYTLVAHLNTSPEMHISFTRACQAIHEHSHNLPVVPFLLAGLVLLGRQYAVHFSPQDKQYLDSLPFLPETLSNVPMDLPILLDIGDNEQERGELHFDSMGDFLAQWTNLTLRDEST